MYGRIWPICGSERVPVLDGIEMDVIDVAGKILFVTDLMFPESPLPYRGLSMLVFRCIHPFATPKIHASDLNCALDDCPPGGKIGIPFGQGPHAMQMIRQQYPGIDHERARGTHGFNCVAQRIAENSFAQDRLPPVSDHGEEIA